MTFIFIAKGHDSKNYSWDRAYDGYLVAGFVFLVFFALIDTLYFRLSCLWGQNGFKEFEQFIIVVISFKITLQLPDQFLVCFM